MSGFVLDWLKELRVDLAVLYIPVEDRSLVSNPVLTETLWLLGPLASIGDLPQLPPGAVGYAEIAKLPLILPSASHGLRELLEREGADRKFSLNTVVEVELLRQHQRSGRSGAGIFHPALQFDRAGGAERAPADLADRRAGAHARHPPGQACGPTRNQGRVDDRGALPGAAARSRRQGKVERRARPVEPSATPLERHCEKRELRSNPFLRLHRRRSGLLRFARNDGDCSEPFVTRRGRIERELSPAQASRPEAR